MCVYRVDEEQGNFMVSDFKVLMDALALAISKECLFILFRYL